MGIDTHWGGGPNSAQVHQGLKNIWGVLLCPSLIPTDNTSGTSVSFLHRGHANLHCIILL